MLHRLGSRLTYANVMATIALFIGLGGSSYAALQVTGKNVKDGSVTGRDIKGGSLTGRNIANASLTSADIRNGTLTLRDLEPGAVPAGPAGGPGPAGPAGRQGPAGDPASVEAYTARAAAGLKLDDYDVTVIAKDLPAGRYVLSATAELQNAGSTPGYQGGISVVDCSIPGYKTNSYYLSPNATYVAEIESLSLTSAIDHPGGPVKLVCSRLWNPAVVRQAALTAVKVGSVR
jgi:hypothetical protein